MNHRADIHSVIWVLRFRKFIFRSDALLSSLGSVSMQKIDMKNTPTGTSHITYYSGVESRENDKYCRNKGLKLISYNNQLAVDAVCISCTCCDLRLWAIIGINTKKVINECCIEHLVLHAKNV